MALAASRSLRRRPADEDEHVGPEGGCFLYGAAIVFEAVRRSAAVTAGNMRRLAEAGDSQPGVPHDACARRAQSRNLIPPQPDKLDAGAGTALRGLLHAPVVRGLLVEAQARRVRWRETHFTPLRRRRARAHTFGGEVGIVQEPRPVCEDEQL